MSEMTAAEEKFLAEIEAHVNNQDDPHGSVKLMLYGDAGTGKTTIAMELAKHVTPKGKTICYMDTAQGWWFIPPKLRENAFRVSTQRIKMIQQVVKACDKKLGRFADVGTIIVDEHSSLANLDLLDLTRANSEKSGKDKDPFAPEWKDMNASSNRMLIVSSALILLEGVNVILLAHERTDKDESTGVVKAAPLHLPKYSSRLSGMLNLVGRCTADSEQLDNGKVGYKRQVQVNPTKHAEAKCKIGGLDRVKISPEELVKVITKWLTVKTEPEVKFNSLEEELEGN